MRAGWGKRWWLSWPASKRRTCAPAMCSLISFLQQPRLSLCHVEWLPRVGAKYNCHSNQETKWNRLLTKEQPTWPLFLLLLLWCRIVISGAQFAMSDCCVSDAALVMFYCGHFFPQNLYFSSLRVHVFPPSASCSPDFKKTDTPGPHYYRHVSFSASIELASSARADPNRMLDKMSIECLIKCQM